MKNVIVFGSQQIAIDCIKILLRDKNANLVAVVGCQRARDITFGYPSLEKFCKQHSLRYYNPSSLSDQFLKIIRRLKPDICFSIYFRNIFNRDYISVPPMGYINIHPSLLPKYRGSVPTYWALVNNEKRVGTTMHYIDSGVDTGDIIAQIECDIPKNITGFTLNNLMMKKGTELFRRQLPRILSSKNARHTQQEAYATYFGQFNQALRTINWSLPVNYIKKHVQALTKPYRGARSFVFDEELIIWEVEIVRHVTRHKPKAGKIVGLRGNGFIVRGGDGFIYVKHFEMKNSKIAQTYIKIGNVFQY